MALSYGPGIEVHCLLFAVLNIKFGTTYYIHPQSPNNFIDVIRDESFTVCYTLFEVEAKCRIEQPTSLSAVDTAFSCQTTHTTIPPRGSHKVAVCISLITSSNQCLEKTSI